MAGVRAVLEQLRQWLKRQVSTLESRISRSVTVGTVTHSLTHSRAVSSCRFRFFLYSCAMLGTSGSAGFGSVRSEESERITL